MNSSCERQWHCSDPRSPLITSYSVRDRDKIKTISPGEMITVPTKMSLSYVSFDKALEHTWAKTGVRALTRIPTHLWGMLSEWRPVVQSSNIALNQCRLEQVFSIIKSLILQYPQLLHLYPPLLLFCYRKSGSNLVISARTSSRTSSSFDSISFLSFIYHFLGSQIARTVGLEFPPTTAILGGIVGQDVLNVLGGKELPVRNLMIYQGDSGAANVYGLSVTI